MSVELDEFLAEALPNFDAVLAKRGVDLSQRALKASMLIVEHCIIDIKGDTKDDYWDKIWFSSLFQSVNKWYEKRYGDALQQRKSSTVSTVVSAFGTPFRADVPLFVNELPQPDKTFWLCFPTTVLSNEVHMSWIINPPNFDSSNEEERNRVSSTLIESATHLRAIHVNLMTADHKDERTQSLAQGILPHLEKGALDIFHANPNSLSMAVWELNFACEKIIKTFLRQQQVDPPNIHDIHRLHKLAINNLGGNKMDAAVAMLPSEKVAIKHRYAEILPPPLAEIFSIYSSALSIVNGYSHKLSREFILDNAKFHFKIPPWLDHS